MIFTRMARWVMAKQMMHKPSKRLSIAVRKQEEVWCLFLQDIYS